MLFKGNSGFSPLKGSSRTKQTVADKHSTRKGKPKHPSRRSGTRHWVVAVTTAGIIFAFSVGNSRVVKLVNAQEKQGQSKGEQGTADNRRTHRFDIPPGTLSTVVETYEKITGVQVLIPSTGIQGIMSRGVSGLISDELALKQLLAGTGIDYKFLSRDSAALEIRLNTESVEVKTDSEAQVTSNKYTEPLLDTPQSVSVITREVMQDQGATTLRDTLRNVAGISIAAGEGGAQGDNLTIRGFSARNDIFIDSMRDFGSYYRDPFNYEEIEVLKGPSAVAFGRGTTGGVVNQQTKTPETYTYIKGSLSFGTDLTRRITADIDQKIPQLGKGAAFRLNLMGDEGNVAGRDIAENRRIGVAPSLALGMGTANRWTFSYFHISEDDIPDYGIPWLLNGPAPVARQNYYGFKDANFLRTGADIGTVKFDHDFNTVFTLHNQIRYAHYTRNAQITEAQILGTVKPTTPLASINVNRNQISVDSVETFLQEQTDLTASFKTGNVKHTLVSGVEIGRETSDPRRLTYTGVATTSLLNPDTNQQFLGVPSVRSVTNATSVSFAGYFLDTAKIGQKWEFTGGLRWDRFNSSVDQFIAPATAFDRVDEFTSVRAAAVYKPKQNGSIYVDYGTSFNPSAESLALTAGTVSAPAEKNRTYEVGTKWELFARKLSVRASIFRTDKTNARETDPTNPLLVVVAGSQRVDGFEAEITGRITNRWQILASYDLLDSKVTGSKFFPLALGAPLANVPRNTFSTWTNYQLPFWKLTVGGGAQFVDSRTSSSTVPFDPVTGLLKQVPSYWVFNSVIKYAVTERVSLQVNLDNLTNRYYYDQIHPAHIVPGPARSALLGLNFSF